MKAVLFEKYGPPEVLKLKEVPAPTPKEDEVLIRIHATTVVPADCEMRSFTFPLWFWLPMRLYVGLRKPTRVQILGQELAGKVVATGKSVTQFQQGDQVFASPEAKFSTYAEYICISEHKALALKPTTMTYEEAAALPTGGLNALHYLREGDISSGERVLINGAAGNIGSFAVQIAKSYGAYVIGVDSAPKLQTVRALGADHVIDYTQEDFTQNGETYDVIFDVVGTSSFRRCLKVLTEGGRYLLANPRPHQMLRGVWVSKTSDKRIVFKFSSYTADDLRILKDMVDTGHLTSFIDKNYALEDIAEAHRYVDGGQKIGNVTITIA